MDTPHTLNYFPLTQGVESGCLSPGGKWLVVDDDPMMRTVMATVLEEQANTAVIECDSGNLAWEAWKRFPGIAGVVTDRHMPGMDGLELAARIHAQRPEIPIILVTACLDGLDLSELREIGVREVIAKPFSCDELVSAIHGILAATSWLAAA